MDSLKITGLMVKTRIGIHAWEQQIEQKLIINLQIPIQVNANEDIESHVDYDSLCRFATHFLESNAFKLIETVAERLAERLKSEFSLSGIHLEVSKPHAVKNAANISVSITR